MKGTLFTLGWVSLLVLGCSVPATTDASLEGVTAPASAYEVVAEGAPFVAPEATSPLALAVRGEELPVEAATLPQEAREALQRAQVADPQALHLLLYAGQQPSGGHRVELTSLQRTPESGLEVTYRVAGPGPDEGAATVLTYPYLILRLDAPELGPAEVRFVEE